MQKPGIKSRVFITFSIFSILFVNIFMYLLYFLVVKNIKTNTYNSIANEYSTIKSFIDLQKTGIFILPKYEIEKLNSNGFYFYIGNNDFTLQKKYQIGLIEKQNEIIFRGDYKGFNIIIGKKLTELENIKNSFLKIALILNIFLVLGSLALSYLITKYSLKPLTDLANFLNNYKLLTKGFNPLKKIKNNYGNTEIGILTKAINNFIAENNEILDKQKSFIQDASHELKTPLMQINSNIELIEDKIKDEKVKNKIEEIKNSSKNISEILSNLNFILRGEEKNLKLEEIDLEEYLKNFIKKYEVLAKQKNIKIIIEKKAHLKIKSNKYYLDRLFGNLLENAINYNKGNGEIKIIISQQGGLTPGKSIKQGILTPGKSLIQGAKDPCYNAGIIEIIDQGIGIEKKELNKIFDRFYRNPNSGIYNSNGNGLGLSIIKKVCDMFGWKIEVKSEVGKGSRFVIKIV